MSWSWEGKMREARCFASGDYVFQTDVNDVMFE